MGGSCYFVIYMDGHSRYTKLYFINYRYEFTRIYRDFVGTIKTQFLKISRSIVLKMPWNIVTLSFLNFSPKMVLLFIVFVQELPSKMVDQNVNVGIFWILQHSSSVYLLSIIVLERGLSYYCTHYKLYSVTYLR